MENYHSLICTKEISFHLFLWQLWKKKNDRKNDMKRKTNDSLSFHGNKQQKQSFEKEELGVS